VLGGSIAQERDHLLVGVREGLFTRALPLATRNLQIATTRLGDQAGIAGAAAMAIDQALRPEAVDRAVRAAS
jgi:predicted NBD/HSP70 family sugar kinase